MHDSGVTWISPLGINQFATNKREVRNLMCVGVCSLQTDFDSWLGYISSYISFTEIKDLEKANHACKKSYLFS